jgi:hypothetical protein
VLSWVWVGDPAVSGSIVITACAVVLAGMTLASPLARRVAALLALPVYYPAATLLVPPSMIGGPDEVTSGWDGPLRVTVTCAPFAVLLGRSHRGGAAHRPARPGRQPGSLTRNG